MLWLGDSDNNYPQFRKDITKNPRGYFYVTRCNIYSNKLTTVK